jgi:hypothetical protein
MRAPLILALALLLLLAQACIVGVGLFAPRVSAQYRAFFIDRTTTDWVREPAGGMWRGG